MSDCIIYKPGFVKEPEALFAELWAGLDWERRGATPRREYYCNTESIPYTYGSGAGVRTYDPKPWTPAILEILKLVEADLGASFEVCFLNGYEDSKDHLGWHADDSPEMDDTRPIAIVSLGATREIWFRANATPEDLSKVTLAPGSLCVMKPGMQDTHMHRIPKAGYDCGARISLTFRGYSKVNS